MAGEAAAAATMLGVSATGEHDVITKLREGFPASAIHEIEAQLGLTHAAVASLLSLPQRSFARRTKARRLSQHESEVLLRLARVFQSACEVLGAKEKAVRWLQRPNRSLGNVPPLQMLDTEAGARQVDDVLGRIAYGVYG